MSNTQKQISLRQACVDDLKAARIFVNLSQAHVARAVGMSRSYYARVERGTTNVSLETLDRIRGVLVTTVPQYPSLARKVAHKVFLARQGRFAQEALGEAAGLSSRYVGRLEHCETNAGIDQIEAIAKVLDIDPIEIVGM